MMVLFLSVHSYGTIITYPYIRPERLLLIRTFVRNDFTVCPFAHLIYIYTYAGEGGVHINAIRTTYTDSAYVTGEFSSVISDVVAYIL